MYKNILVPVDGSATATRGLEEAIRLARDQGANIRLVHVVSELLPMGSDTLVYSERIVESLREDGRRVLKEAEDLVRQQGLQPQAVLIESLGHRSADSIVEQAAHWPADLIVLGTHGRRGLRRFALGSDAESVVRLSPTPVLLVRSDETAG